MTSRFRTVFFVPEPWIGGGFPVAALLERGPELVLVLAERQPNLAALDDPKLVLLLPGALENVRASTALDVRSPRIGPHIDLGHIVELPAAFTDPVYWLRNHFLPRPYVPPAARSAAVV